MDFDDDYQNPNLEIKLSGKQSLKNQINPSVYIIKTHHLRDNAESSNDGFRIAALHFKCKVMNAFANDRHCSLGELFFWMPKKSRQIDNNLKKRCWYWDSKNMRARALAMMLKHCQKPLISVKWFLLIWRTLSLGKCFKFRKSTQIRRPCKQ